MFAVVTFSIIAAGTLAASIATVLVTVRDGYRQVPTRQF